VLSIAAGPIILARPGAGAVAIAIAIGVYAPLFGFGLIGLGFRLGRLSWAWADTTSGRRDRRSPCLGRAPGG
jgi:hypothetical protein